MARDRIGPFFGSGPDSRVSLLRSGGYSPLVDATVFPLNKTVFSVEKLVWLFIVIFIYANQVEVKRHQDHSFYPFVELVRALYDEKGILGTKVIS